MRRRTYLAGMSASVVGTVLSGCTSGGEVEVGDDETPTGEQSTPTERTTTRRPTGEPPGETTAEDETATTTDDDPATTTEDDPEQTNGLSVETYFEDTETNPGAAVSAARSLVDRGVPYVCGPAASGVALPVFEESLVPNRVVGCTPSATAPALSTLRDDDYTFRTAPSDTLQARAMATVAAEEAGADTAAVLARDNEYGRQLATRFQRAFEAGGGSITAEVLHAQGRSSYTSPLQQALSSEPDALAVVTYPDDATRLFRDFYADFDVSLSAVVVPDALRDPELPSRVDDDMDDVMGLAPAAAGPGLDAFRRAYETAYGGSPGVFAEQAYDAVAVGILAGAAAGTDDAAAIRGQMRAVANPDGIVVTPENFAEGVAAAARGEAVDYRGASSAVNFDERGDPAIAPYDRWEFDGASIRDVETLQVAGKRPQGSGPEATDAPGSDPGRTIPIGILLPETGTLGPVAGSMIRAARLPPRQVEAADIRL